MLFSECTVISVPRYCLLTIMIHYLLVSYQVSVRVLPRGKHEGSANLGLCSDCKLNLVQITMLEMLTNISKMPLHLR